MKPGKAGIPGKDVQSVFDVGRNLLRDRSKDGPPPEQRRTMQKKRPEDDEKRKRDG